MNRKQTLLYVLIIAVIVLFVGLIALNFEIVEEETSSGYSELARSNEFLACERFLKKLNYDVSTHQRQISFNQVLKSAQSGTIIMRYNAQLETKGTFDELMFWMEKGGHLILELNSSLYPRERETKVGLLKEFNLSLDNKNIFLEDAKDVTTMVQIYRDGEEFETDFVSNYSIGVESEDYTVKVDDENGTHLVEFNVGEGSVTFISDIDIWKNRFIDKYDHAALLVEILGRNPGNIDIITAINMPSLLEIIWFKGKWFCVSMALLLAFYLWSLFEKFGPALALMDTSRRSLIEHLDAAAKFDWRHFRGATLLSSARNDLTKYLDGKHPSIKQKSPQELHQWIHEKTNIPVVDIAAALDGDTANAGKLLHAIQIIQKLRKQL